MADVVVFDDVMDPRDLPEKKNPYLYYIVKKQNNYSLTHCSLVKTFVQLLVNFQESKNTKEF